MQPPEPHALPKGSFYMEEYKFVEHTSWDPEIVDKTALSKTISPPMFVDYFYDHKI